ncbi:hypothetical protein HID58_024364 [Brassica napus]|uniref:Uncharacterized protein n=1 Tax=Brassica napus TaxID=3708 RepID=A0ABQ8D4N3_BRANA|nr:hypothetical protein HID58_024364 [Brassica napus]
MGGSKPSKKDTYCREMLLIDEQVTDHSITIFFSWNSVMSALHDSPIPYEDCFQFHSYGDFEASYNLKDNLYGKLSNISYHL